MSQTIQANLKVQVESVARMLPPSARDDFRALMNDGIIANLIAQAPGGNLIQPGGAPVGSSAPPVGVTHTASGANGVVTVAITNPATAKQANNILHEISYSPLKSFTQSVTTLPPTTSTNVQVQQPGALNYYRLRSSFDGKTWGPYTLSAQTPIDAGLVESSAMAPAAAFNQTNFGEVNSQASGSSAEVTVSGPGGLLTAYTAVKGSTQQVRPSATIVGIAPGSEQFVGWDGEQFRLKPSLADVFADDLEPVGKVSVVSTATPTPPTIVPIVVGGGVVGFDVTAGGAGASQPYTLVIVGAGVGATAGAQSIVAGVLQSVAPGNAGSGYGGGTTVTVTGGSGGSTPGGGTSIGGNGGRLTAV